MTRAAMRREETRYARTADLLRGRILAGDWTSGARMPPERLLTGELGVSRITLRRALDLLSEERLVVRRHGSGTYVAAPAARRIPLRIDYTTSMAAHAPGLRRRLLHRSLQPAPAGAAVALGIEPGTPVLAAERLDRVGAEPVAWDQAWIARVYAKRLDRRLLARVDFIEAWTRAEGFHVSRCRQRIESVPAPPSAARRLGLAAGAPVLRSTEVYMNGRGVPAGVFVSWYHPARICIDAAYEWPPEDRAAKPCGGPTG